MIKIMDVLFWIHKELCCFCDEKYFSPYNGIILTIFNWKINKRKEIIELSKDAWSELILGEKHFAGLHDSLKAFDKAIGRIQ